MSSSPLNWGSRERGAEENVTKEPAAVLKMGRDHTTPICQRSLQPSNNSKTKIRVVVIFSLGWLIKFYMWLKLPQSLRLRNWLFCLAAVLGGLFQEKAKWLLDCWLLLCILTIFQFVFNLSISFLHSRPTVYFELLSTGLIMLRVFFFGNKTVSFNTFWGFNCYHPVYILASK